MNADDLLPKYHHAINLARVKYEEIVPEPKYSDGYPGLIDAYRWLEKEMGFYPLFLAVGTTTEDFRMTGYEDNWRVRLSSWYDAAEKKFKGTYRKKGEFPNIVLFSFNEVNGVFMDFQYWHIVLNSEYRNYQLTEYEKRLIFKPSWPKSRWLRKARKEPVSVQIVSPKLNLPDADRVWARNIKTKRALESVGFKNVEVKRIPVECPA